MLEGNTCACAKVAMAETPIGSTEKNLILMTVPPFSAIHLHSITKDPAQLFFALEEDRTAAQNSAVL